MQIQIGSQIIPIGPGPEKLARYAASSALSKTASQIKREVREEMPKVFDRPTPWILNSLLMKGATAKNLTAKVWFKDEAFKGVAPDKYMGTHVFGGSRPEKRSERQLGGYVVPTEAAEKDQYGNVRRGQITKILSNVNRNVDQYSNTPAQRRGRTGQYFMGTPRGQGGRPFAVYLRTATGLTPVLFFQKAAPKYKKRLPFYEIAQMVIDRDFARTFESELSRMQART